MRSFSAVQKKIKKFLTYLFALFLFFSAHSALAADLTVSPSSGSFSVGDTVTVRIVLSSPSQSANAVSGLVSVSPSIFSIQSVSKASSVLNFWVKEPAISAGTVKFEGIALSGFTGLAGTVVSINLRAIKAGTGQVLFTSGQILANDGQGTDITTNLNGGNFIIKAAVPPSVVPAAAPEPLPIPPPEPVPAPAPAPAPVPEIPQPAPTLKAPVISIGSKNGAPAVLGTSEYPNAQTLITFISETGTKIFILGTAENDGSFNILVPNSLKRGAYAVTAVMIKDDKSNSDTSNAIIVKVGSIISDITFEIWLMILALVVVVLYLLLRIYFHLRKDRQNIPSIKSLT
jgi:hypothetical protein